MILSSVCDRFCEVVNAFSMIRKSGNIQYPEGSNKIRGDRKTTSPGNRYNRYEYGRDYEKGEKELFALGGSSCGTEKNNTHVK